MSLYKYDKKGNVRKWRAFIANDFLYTETGKIDGKMSISKGKSVKSDKDVNLLYKRYRKKGWVDSVDKIIVIPKREGPKKMDEKNIKKIIYPVILQPKLDGVYAKYFHCKNNENVYSKKLLTRQNILISKFEHINIELGQLSALLSLYFDEFCIEGELYMEIVEIYEYKNFIKLFEFIDEDMNKYEYTYCVDKADNKRYNFKFQDNSCLVYRPSFDYISSIIRTIDVNINNDLMKFNIFNIITNNVNFMDRYSILTYFMNKYEFLYLNLVEIQIINEESEIYKKHNELSIHYEGIILRNRILPELTLKVKYEYDEEYQVVFYKEGDGKMKNMVIWYCILEPFDENEIQILKQKSYSDLGEYIKKLNNVFKLVPSGNDEDKRRMFLNANDFLFKFITVYFKDKTVNNIPKFATTKTGNESDFRVD
jgi:hypothetical protein